nr:hypothetical protein [Tanacetum cinerariifolium]
SILADEYAIDKAVADIQKKKKPDDADRDEDPYDRPDQPKSTSKFAQVEEIVFEAGDTQVPQDLREDMGNNDKPPVVNVDPKYWFKKPKRPPTPDPEWNEGGSTDKTYTTSSTKTKDAKYNLPGIKDMVPNLWSPIKVAYVKHSLLADLDTMSMDDLYNNFKVYELKVKGMSSSSSSTQNMAFVSSSNNNTSSTNGAINTAQGVSTISTQVNDAFSINIDNLSNAVICSFFASQSNSPQLVHEDLEQIHLDDMEEIYLRWKMAMLTMRARRKCRALKSQDNKYKESSRRSVPMETSASTALVSCDGLGGYDWRD